MAQMAKQRLSHFLELHGAPKSDCHYDSNLYIICYNIEMNTSLDWSESYKIESRETSDYSCPAFIFLASKSTLYFYFF